MIIALSGWRGWTDRRFIEKQIDREWSRLAAFGPIAEPMHFRVGDCPTGVDAIVHDYLSFTASIASLTRYVADWDHFEPRAAAGPARNKDMLSGHSPADPMYGHPADLLVAFPQPGRLRPRKGSGTWSAIEIAQWLGVEVRIPGYRLAILPETPDVFAALGSVAS